MSQALSLLLPGVEIIHELMDLRRNPDEYLSEKLTSVDTLITLDRRCLESARVLAHPNLRIICIPEIFFPAFHPDIVYATGPDGKFVQCLESDYHSALCLWGWKHGLSVEKVIDLFCDEVYSALGYGNLWDASVSELKNSFEAVGFEFITWWRKIQRAGAFMWSINHPRVLPIAELTKQLAIQVGASPQVENLPLDDVLSELIDPIRWPIYPSIAKQYGVPGSYIWRIRECTYSSLTDYVRSAYTSYDNTGLSEEHINFYLVDYGRFDTIMRSQVDL